MGGYFLIIPSSTETYLPFCLSKMWKKCLIWQDYAQLQVILTTFAISEPSPMPSITPNCPILVLITVRLSQVLLLLSSFQSNFSPRKHLILQSFRYQLSTIEKICNGSVGDLGLITNTEAFVRFMLDIWFSDGLQTVFVQKSLVSKCNCCFNEKFWSVLQNNVFDFFNSFV